MDLATLPQIRTGMGWPGIAMYVSAYRSRGKHLSEERFFSPPKRFAKAHIAAPDHPMPARICENVARSAFSFLTVGWRQAMCIDGCGKIEA